MDRGDGGVDGTTPDGNRPDGGSADGGSVDWEVKTWGGIDNESIRSVAVDKSGNIYLGGYFNDKIEVGHVTLTGKGQEALVVKLSPTGNVVWAVSGGGSGTDYINGIVVDSDGTVVVTGTFTSKTATFDSKTVSTTGKHDIFVARLSSSGTFLNAVSAGGSGVDKGNRVEVDQAGNLYVIGYLTRPAAFGTRIVSGNQDHDAFVARLDASLAFSWVAVAGGAGADSAYTAAVDGAGSIYLCGDFSGKASFGSLPPLISAGGLDGFVAKLDAKGDFKWVKQVGGVGTDSVKAVEVDGAQNIYITGAFKSPAVVGTLTPKPLAGGGGQDVFVARLDSSGDVTWLAQAGGQFDEAVRDMALDASGKILITGTFSVTVAFGTTILTGKAGNDVYVARVSPGAAFDWATAAVGSGSLYSWRVALHAGRGYVAGGFDGTATFGGTGVTAKAQSDIFLWKVQPPP